jgi:hypothetical protein
MGLKEIILNSPFCLWRNPATQKNIDQCYDALEINRREQERLFSKLYFETEEQKRNAQRNSCKLPPRG